MFWEFIVPVIVILLLCYFLLPKFKYGVDLNLNKTRYMLNELVRDGSRNNIRNNIHLDLSNKQNPEKQRTDKCLASSPEQCPVGTYKQCTNNLANHGKCDCTDQRSYELCSKDVLQDPLAMDEVLKLEEKDYGKYATRVNQWTVDESTFNDPGNLHIQRTNPYVEELEL